MAGFGETLHQARAHMGVTLKEAEQATRINRHHLAALEEVNFAALPPLIYQRGIVRNYASYLQLDPSKLLVMFEEAHGGSGKLPAANVADVPPINMPSHWAPNFAIIAFSVVLSAIVFAWVYSAFVAQPEVELTPTMPAPTATPFESDIPVPTIAATQAPPTVTPTEVSTPSQTTTSGSRDASTDDPLSQRRGGDNVIEGDGDERADEPQDATEASTIEQITEVEPAVEQSTFDESDLTSIQVTAGQDIYVTITADGAIQFDGNLAAGQSTGHVTGNTFDVYASRGVHAVFTSACGDEFLMGYESGEATYQLQKQPDSCAPID